MPDKSKKFHNFALNSSLFKGRKDWYFCYLKSERIAHVLTVLSERSDTPSLKDIGRAAQSLPGEIARMAAGEFELASVLADVFSLLASLRLTATMGALHSENCVVLVREYESLAERLMAGSHPSPFVATEDFFVPELSVEPLQSLSPRLSETVSETQIQIKDTLTKGHSKGQSTRASQILDYIRKHKSVSIKEIAATIRDCSEKTVQRELNVLIDQGLVRRVGERRWSTYEPA